MAQFCLTHVISGTKFHHQKTRKRPWQSHNSINIIEKQLHCEGYRAPCNTHKRIMPITCSLLTTTLLTSTVVNHVFVEGNPSQRVRRKRIHVNCSHKPRQPFQVIAVWDNKKWKCISETYKWIQLLISNKLCVDWDYRYIETLVMVEKEDILHAPSCTLSGGSHEKARLTVGKRVTRASQIEVVVTL